MPKTGGQLVRLVIDGVEYDPIGDWTLTPAILKKEESETTRKDTYFTEVAKAGKIVGQIANTSNIIIDELQGADAVSVMAEEVNGRIWNGNMSYTADGDVAVNDGTIQIEMTGKPFAPVN